MKKGLTDEKKRPDINSCASLCFRLSQPWLVLGCGSRGPSCSLTWRLTGTLSLNSSRCSHVPFNDVPKNLNLIIWSCSCWRWLLSESSFSNYECLFPIFHLVSVPGSSHLAVTCYLLCHRLFMIAIFCYLAPLLCKNNTHCDSGAHYLMGARSDLLPALNNVAWISSPSLCSYFAVVVYKVVVLIVQEFGGTGAFLKRFSGKPFKVSTGPCCCCCLCLPRVPMSRYPYLFVHARPLYASSGSSGWSLLFTAHFYSFLIPLVFTVHTFIFFLCWMSLILVYVSNPSGDGFSSWSWGFSSMQSWRRCSPSSA